MLGSEIFDERKNYENNDNKYEDPAYPHSPTHSLKSTAHHGDRHSLRREK